MNTYPEYFNQLSPDEIEKIRLKTLEATPLNKRATNIFNLIMDNIVKSVGGYFRRLIFTGCTLIWGTVFLIALIIVPHGIITYQIGTSIRWF